MLHGEADGKERVMEWIPIEREAPKDGQKILVCYEDGTILGTRYNPRSISTWLAWMPQPKPYTADTPQKCEDCDHWSDTQDGCADRHGCYTPQTEMPEYAEWKDAYNKMTDCGWK